MADERVALLQCRRCRFFLELEAGKRNRWLHVKIANFDTRRSARMPCWYCETNGTEFRPGGERTGESIQACDIGRARAARPEDVGHCFRRARGFESSRYTRARLSKTGGTRAPRARNDGRGASKTPARAEAAGKGFRKGVQSESSSRAAGCQRAVRERKHSKPGGIFDCNGYIKAERGRATGGPIFYCAQLW